MGYSSGFLRGVLALVTVAALLGLGIGIGNEVFDLGLFIDGYPAPLSGPGAEFGSFAIQLAAAAILSTAVNLALERHER